MVFSPELQKKIDILKARACAVQMGRIHFANPLIMAPLAGITDAAFRLLMEDLGAGGTVSELISCHAVDHGNLKTIKMLTPDPREKNVGMQLFGENPTLMASAAKVAESKGAKFIDINMGCPVRKVVTKGGGSALLLKPELLYDFVSEIRQAISIPLTVKIRMGWDLDSLNAHKVIPILCQAGAEIITLHGRTRSQQYAGTADWDYIEKMQELCTVPFIGNGDLHQAWQVRKRLESTKCQGLMLGRGPLRNPFIFLQSFDSDEEIHFTPKDYLEVALRYAEYLSDHLDRPRTLLIQWVKMVVWFAAGYPGVAKFRLEILSKKELGAAIECAAAYFTGLGDCAKQVPQHDSFLSAGHG